MKRIFHFFIFIFIIALTLVFSLLSESFSLQSQKTICSIDYIRELKSKTVVLVSGNPLQGELSVRQTQNNLGFSSIYLFVVPYFANNLFFNDQTLGFNVGSFLKIFNSIQNTHFIRAP